MDGNLTIQYCYNICSVDVGSFNGIGGIAGHNTAFGGDVNIYNCYSNYNGGGDSCGGIIGRQWKNESGTINISNCYFMGDFSGNNCGAICGARTVTDNSGTNSSVTMTNCYYIRASSSVDDLNAYGGSNDTNFAITNFMSSIGWSDDIAFGTIAQEALGSNNTELFNIQWEDNSGSNWFIGGADSDLGSGIRDEVMSNNELNAGR